MEYGCYDCGHIFEAGEERLYIEPHGERVWGCPLCGGTYGDAVTCRICGASISCEDYPYGVCDDCIARSITIENFTSYVLEMDLIPDFVFFKIIGIECPKSLSRSTYERLLSIYDAETISNPEILSLCREFILEDDGEIGKEDYVLWLLNL